MAKLQIGRKLTVWTTKFIEYDETKYTEEEFINQFHRVENGYSDGKLEGCLYETYEYEIHQHSADELTPEENGNQPTIEIMGEDGETIYDNNSKIYKGARYKGLV